MAGGEVSDGEAGGADQRPHGAAPERGGELAAGHGGHGGESAVPERGEAQRHPRDVGTLPN